VLYSYFSNNNIYVTVCDVRLFQSANKTKNFEVESVIVNLEHANVNF
jgi:hypothetical protein